MWNSVTFEVLGDFGWHIIYLACYKKFMYLTSKIKYKFDVFFLNLIVLILLFFFFKIDGGANASPFTPIRYIYGLRCVPLSAILTSRSHFQKVIRWSLGRNGSGEPSDGVRCPWSPDTSSTGIAAAANTMTSYRVICYRWPHFSWTLSWLAD